MSPTRLSLSLSLFLSLPVASSSGVQLITVAIRTEGVCVCIPAAKFSFQIAHGALMERWAADTHLYTHTLAHTPAH